MASRLRQHVNPFSIRQLLRRGETLEITPGRPAEVELGCGDGQFLFERAQNAPERLHVGVEIRPELVQEVQKRGFPNVTAVCANLLVADALLPPHSIERLFVNFPDPWFKRRHQARRWLQPEVAARLVDALVAGGELFFQSDVFDLALDALSVLEGQPALKNQAGEWRFARANPFGARSRREQWCEEHNQPIWRLHFAK